MRLQGLLRIATARRTNAFSGDLSAWAEDAKFYPDLPGFSGGTGMPGIFTLTDPNCVRVVK